MQGDVVPVRMASKDGEDFPEGGEAGEERTRDVSKGVEEEGVNDFADRVYEG